MFCNCKMCQLSDFVNFVGHKYFCRANGQWKYLFRRNFIQAVIQKKLVTTLKYRVVKVSPGGSLPGRGQPQATLGSLGLPWAALHCLGQLQASSGCLALHVPLFYALLAPWGLWSLRKHWKPLAVLGPQSDSRALQGYEEVRGSKGARE